ncbi:MAG TPA: N-acetyltransferase [Gammaproteobacteria bacterium]|nr:N-acetyltransferase [Gammaproteobacteria bacterium]
MLSPTPLSIRPARLTDLNALLALEVACFDSDRLSRRSFRHALTGAHAACLVAELDDGIGGYALVFFHRGTSLARLYSLAVMPDFRGQQIGERLLEAAQVTAREHGCISLRLEIRRDNLPALRLYQRMGYQQIGSYADYYADHMDAIRMERTLINAQTTYIS